jgi:Flp pilus assembly protein TadD
VTKHYSAAAASARAAIRLNPLDGPAHHLLGLSLKQLGQRDAALEALREAVRLSPGRTEALIHLAEAEIEMGLFEAAKQHLDTAARLAGVDDPLVKAARRFLADRR